MTHLDHLRRMGEEELCDAEGLFSGLTWSLRDLGADPVLVAVTNDESSFDAIRVSDMRFWDLDVLHSNFQLF